MWQPSRLQWTIICLVALVVVLGWPPDEGRSLGTKFVNWVADPRGTLPVSPKSLPMSLDDDGDAVTQHDMLENAYHIARERSDSTRWRMDLKEAEDPFESSTSRQLLVGLMVLGALGVWRLEAARRIHRRTIP